jgi:hypothetical protein
MMQEHHPNKTRSTVTLIDRVNTGFVTRNALQAATAAHRRVNGAGAAATSKRCANEITLITAIAGPTIKTKGGTAPAAWAVGKVVSDAGPGGDEIEILATDRIHGATSQAEAHTRAAICALQLHIDAGYDSVNICVSELMVPQMAHGRIQVKKPAMVAVMGTLTDLVARANNLDDGTTRDSVRFTHFTGENDLLHAFDRVKIAAEDRQHGTHTGGHAHRSDRIARPVRSASGTLPAAVYRSPSRRQTESLQMQPRLVDRDFDGVAKLT